MTAETISMSMREPGRGLERLAQVKEQHERASRSPGSLRQGGDRGA